MTEPRSTIARRNARAGLVAVRIGPRVYWVASEVARAVEAKVRQWIEEAEKGKKDEPAGIDRRNPGSG